MRKDKKKGIVLQLIAVALILVVGLSIIMIVHHAKAPEQEQQRISKTIVIDGVEYFPRQDIDVLLLMGIDKDGPVEASGSYNNDGEADMVMLVIFDHASQSVRTLGINRDTMTEIPVLGIGGKATGSVTGQLALAHTYGSGLEDSCENTRQAVSNLFGGITIDYYMAMHMDAIAIVNDAVGGVTVDVTDDFSQTDTPIPMGTTTLRGDQAITFVRYRKNVGDELNTSRMQRQMDYVDGFFAALQKTMEQGSGFVAQTYEEVDPYIVTDCSSTVLSSMLERYSDYALEHVQDLRGTSKKGEEFMEFYPDGEALNELVLELFYAPK